VNYIKSSATLIRGDAQDEILVFALLEPIARFLIKYLGLQLAIRPLTKAEGQRVLDKFLVCIPSWQDGTIAKEGRLVLIKSVISARPLHQLLITDAPVWLLYEVNKWARAFFWARKEEVNGGQCLVAWDNICKLTCFGGLGVDDLKLHGLVYLMGMAAQI
jgi:hypothetical protein